MHACVKNARYFAQQSNFYHFFSVSFFRPYISVLLLKISFLYNKPVKVKFKYQKSCVVRYVQENK